MDFGDQKRQLVVIDEALDIVRSAQVKLEDVNFILGVLPQDLKDCHSVALQAIEVMRGVLEQIHELSKARKEVENDKVVYQGTDNNPGFLMDELREDLREHRWDAIVGEKHDEPENRRTRERLDRIIRDINSTLSSWNYYSRKGQYHTLNTASLIVPDGLSGAVVLDATANQNLLWDLFEDRAVIIETPRDARCYANVDIHVSRMSQLGKTNMAAYADKRSSQLMIELTHKIKEDSSVLLVCHKDVEHWMVCLESPFRRFEVAHWGAIEGRNDWQEFDTVVIAGIPYRDRIWASNIFMAIRGLQSSRWLQDSTKRGFGEIEDVQRGLNISQITVSIIQAINRIRCRRVVDLDGNCPRSDVYLLLPYGKEGDQIIEGIRTEMPLVNEFEWNFEWTETSSSSQRTNYKEGMLRLLMNTKNGNYPFRWFQERLAISKRHWNRLVKDIKEGKSLFAQKLSQEGVQYVTLGKGRGSMSYLAKQL
jgi:hypothetical protein